MAQGSNECHAAVGLIPYMQDHLLFTSIPRPQCPPPSILATATASLARHTRLLHVFSLSTHTCCMPQGANEGHAVASLMHPCNNTRCTNPSHCPIPLSPPPIFPDAAASSGWYELYCMYGLCQHPPAAWPRGRMRAMPLSAQHHT